MTEHFSVRMTLLDAQLVDADRLPVGRVDDLVLDLEGGRPRISLILTGSQALGERLGGPLGRLMASVSARMRSGGEPSGPTELPAALVVELLPLVKLNAAANQLTELAGLERWLSHHFIERLPGTGDASE